jgi:hypothetical protein
MPTAKPRYFRIIYDDDAHTMNASGIVVDDNDVTRRTAEMQRAGRHVRISATKRVLDPSRVPSDDSLRAHRTVGYDIDKSLYW